MEVKDATKASPSGRTNRYKKPGFNQRRQKNAEKQDTNSLTDLMEEATLEDIGSGNKKSRVKKNKKKNSSHKTQLVKRRGHEDPANGNLAGNTLSTVNVPEEVPGAHDDDENPDSDEQDIKDYVLGIIGTADVLSFLGVSLSGSLDAMDREIDEWDVDPLESTSAPALPSARPMRKPKGAHAQPPQVSDPDLQERIESAWTNNRRKKAAHKKEREQLRSRGLLQAQKEDMLDDMLDVREQYSSGLNMVNLKQVLERFLKSNSHLHLALPPLSPIARRGVHVVAHMQGLKSKSHGKDEGRFTIISKSTSNDSVWNERVFDRSASKSGLRWALKASERRPGPNIERVSDAEWRDELNMQSRPGVAKAAGWMKKMGWTEGEGLGATSNRGMSEPIFVDKKITRGGLGYEH